MSYRLLTAPEWNPKIQKNIAAGFYTAGLGLAPALESGENLCPAHTKGCAEACLYWSGRGQMENSRNARIRRSRLWIEEPELFLAQLDADIYWLAHEAKLRNLKPAVRLNVTSDVAWEDKLVPHGHPKVQFYDYTKRRDRTVPVNYHLTFSRSEKNGTLVAKTIAAGMNVAAVFLGQPPDTYLGFPVVDGDVNDCRWLDPQGVVVGLRAKGVRARMDYSGFVIRDHVPRETAR